MRRARGRSRMCFRPREAGAVRGCGAPCSSRAADSVRRCGPETSRSSRRRCPAASATRNATELTRMSEGARPVRSHARCARSPQHCSSSSRPAGPGRPRRASADAVRRSASPATCSAPADRRPAPTGLDGWAIIFRPMLRPSAGWVRRNDLAFCHVETPLMHGAPAGYPVFRSPPALARAVRATGFDACSTASNHSLDPRLAGIAATRRALRRAGLRQRVVLLRRASARARLLLRARGVKVAFLSHADDQRHPAAAAVGGEPRPRLTDRRRRAPRPSRRRAGGDRQPALGHRVLHAPDAFQRTLARRLGRSRAITAVVGQHAHARGAADPPLRRHAGRVRRGRPAVEPDRRLLPRGEPGREARPPAPARRAAAGARAPDHATRRRGSGTRTTRSCGRAAPRAPARSPSSAARPAATVP